MSKLEISVDQIMSLNPCKEYTSERVQGLLSQGFTVDTLCSIPFDDASWVLTRLMSETNRRLYTRRCALSVIHLWDAPEVLKEYLTGGDESLRAAAARAAARAAAEAAAEYAARAAVWPAAEVAARAAARYAACGAAEAAARATAWYAAWGAARAVGTKEQERTLISMAFEILEGQGV